MTLYLTEVKYGWLKKSFDELTILKDWRSNAVPAKDDILHIKDERFIVLQRDFFSPNNVKLYVRKL